MLDDYAVFGAALGAEDIARLAAGDAKLLAYIGQSLPKCRTALERGLGCLPTAARSWPPSNRGSFHAATQ